MPKMSGGDGGSTGYADKVYGGLHQTAAYANDNTIKMNGGVSGQCGGRRSRRGSMKKGFSLRQIFGLKSLGKMSKSMNSMKNKMQSFTARRNRKYNPFRRGKTFRRRR